MAKMEKMTYVDALTVAIDCAVLPEDVREKLDALRAQQMKRNSGEKKPTKTQKENVILCDALYEMMKVLDKPMTVTELLAADEQLGKLGNQKVTALLRKLISDGRVVRTEEKRKAYYGVVR